MADKKDIKQKQSKTSIARLAARTWGNYEGKMNMMLNPFRIPGLEKKSNSYVRRNNNNRHHKTDYSHQNKNKDWFAEHYPDHHHLTILDYCNYENKFGQYTLNFKQEGDDYLLNQDAGPNSHDDLSSVGIRLTSKYGKYKNDSGYTINYAGSYFNRTSTSNSNYCGYLDTLGNFMVMVHNNYAPKQDQIIFKGVSKAAFKHSLHRANNMRWNFLHGYKQHFGDYKSRINFDNQNVSEEMSGSSTNHVFYTKDGKKHVKKVKNNGQFRDWMAPYKDHTYKLLNRYFEYPQDIQRDKQGYQKAVNAFCNMPAVKFLCTTRGLDINNVYRDMRKDLVRSYNAHKSYNKYQLDNKGYTSSIRGHYYNIKDLRKRDNDRIQEMAKAKADKVMKDEKLLTPAMRKKLGKQQNTYLYSSTNKQATKFLTDILNAKKQSKNPNITQASIIKNKVHLADYLKGDSRAKFLQYRKKMQSKSKQWDSNQESKLEVSYAGKINRLYLKKSNSVQEPYQNMRAKIAKKFLPLLKKEYTGNYNKKTHTYYQVRKYSQPKVVFPWKMPKNLAQANSKHPDQGKEKTVGNDIIYLKPNDVYHTDRTQHQRGKQIQYHSKHHYAYNIKFGTGKKNLFIFEAPIDARSFGDSFKDYLTKSNSTVASIGGAGKLKSLKVYMSAQHTGPKDFKNIIFCFDNDHGGYENINKYFQNTDRKAYSSIKHHHNVMIMVPGVSRFNQGKSFDFNAPYKSNFHRIFPQDKDYNDIIQTFAHNPKALQSSRLKQVVYHNQHHKLTKINQIKHLGLNTKDLHDKAVKATNKSLDYLNPQHNVHNREALARICSQPMNAEQYTQYQTDMALNSISGHGKRPNDLSNAIHYFHNYNKMSQAIEHDKPTTEYFDKMSREYMSMTKDGRDHLSHFMTENKVRPTWSRGWHASYISPKDLNRSIQQYQFERPQLMVRGVDSKKPKGNPIQTYGKQFVDGTFKDLNSQLSRARDKVYVNKAYALALRGMVPGMENKSSFESKVGHDITRDALKSINKISPKCYSIAHSSVGGLVNLDAHHYLKYTPAAQHAKKYVENRYGTTKTQNYVSQRTTNETKQLVLDKQNKRTPTGGGPQNGPDSDGPDFS